MLTVRKILGTALHRKQGIVCHLLRSKSLNVSGQLAPLPTPNSLLKKYVLGGPVKHYSISLPVCSQPNLWNAAKRSLRILESLRPQDTPVTAT